MIHATDRYYKRYPKVLVEVMSESTETTDRREKFVSYRQIETLQEYVLLAQDKCEGTVFRREVGWRPMVLDRLTRKLELPSLNFKMPLAKIYEGVDLCS